MVRQTANRKKFNARSELQRRRSALRWKKRLKILAVFSISFLISIFLLSLFLESPVFENWLKNILSKRLSEFCRREVTINSVEFKFPSITLTINEVNIAGLPSEKRPFFKTDIIRTQLNFFGLFNREVRFKYIKLYKPELALQMDRNGRMNLPQFNTSDNDQSESFFELVTDRLDMEGGKIFYNNYVLPASGTIRDFKTALRYDSKNNSYSGRIVFSKSDATIADYNNLKASLDSRFVLLPNRLIFPDVHFNFSGVDIRLSGLLYDFKDLKYNFDYNGTIDLKLLSSIFRIPAKIQGTANLDGTGKSSSEGLIVDGILRISETSLEKIKAQKIIAHFQYTPARVQFTEIKADVQKGTVQGGFAVKMERNRTDYVLQLKGNNIDTEGFTDVLHISGLGIASRNSFDCNLNWNTETLDSLNGRFNLILQKDPAADKHYQQFIANLHNECGYRPYAGEPSLNEPIPISGDIHLILNNGNWEIQTSTINLPLTRFVFYGKGKLFETAEQEIKIETQEMKEIDLFLLRLSRILKGWEPEKGLLPRSELPPPFVGLSGSAQFRGRFVLEKGKVFQIYGNGFGKKIWAHNTYWDEGGGFIDFRNNHLAFSKGWTKKRDGSSKFVGEIHLFEQTPEGMPFLKLEAQFTNLPFEDVEDLFFYPRNLTGSISGNFSLNIDHQGKILGSVQARMGNGVFFKDVFETGEADLFFDNDWLKFKRILLQKGMQKIDTELDLSLKDTAFRIKGEIQKLKLDELKSLYLDRSPIAGELSVEIEGNGFAYAPEVDIIGEIENMTFLKKPLGNMEFNIFNEKDRIRLEALIPDDSTFINANMKLRPDYSFQAEMEVYEANLYNLIPYTDGIVDRVFGGGFSGKAKIEGSVLRIGDCFVSGELENLDVSINKYLLELKNPLRFTIHDFILNLDPVLFTDGSSLYTIAGKVGLSRRFPSDLKIDMNVQLSELAPMFINLNLKGYAQGEGYLRGFILNPYWGGKAEIREGYLQYLPMPAPLEDVDGIVKFTQNTVSIENMTGKMGGGEVSGDGQLTFKNSRPDQLLFRFKGDKVNIEYPAGADMLINGSLTLSGEWENKELSGELELAKLHYTRRFDPEEVVASFAKRSSGSAPEKAGFLKTMRANIDIKGTDNLIIDNNFAQVELTADFKLTGNILKPNIIGRIEAQNGQVYYRDRTFQLMSASFENFDPSRLNPVIDLRSKTKVKNYTIYLSLHGTKDQMYPSLSSEPSLPTVDVINLLALGKERSSYYQRSEESLLGVGVSSLLLGPVFGGIEEGAEQLFGFDRFRIDPFLVGSKSNPTARLTVGKRITKDLTLIYSTNISQSQEDVLIMEYRLSDSVIFIASKNEYGAYGVDIQFESKF